MQSSIFKSAIFLAVALCAILSYAQPVEEIADAASEEAAEFSEGFSEEDLAYLEWATEFLDSLDQQTGTIELPGGIASLQVPDDFYYLGPEDTKKVLEEAWGNVPSEIMSLGMLFPSKYTPLDSDSWGVTIDFEEEGYVSDDDAADIDYDDLLKDMKSDMRSESKLRVEQGYESIELIGWAAQPYYDTETHKLYWAKELKFGDMETNTLNYNVRALGRRGVLVLNFIANMDQLEEVEASRNQVLAIATFNDGHRYSQFNPDIDKVAAYGIGGLIAGKVMLKTGLIATVLILLKKFWFLLFIPFIWLRRLFGGKPSQ